MIIFKKIADIQPYLQREKDLGVSTGFVPTMGALHEGHLSLIAKSRAENQLTICSIFVNPTQFNNSEDFEKYPVSIEKDIHLLDLAGCQVLFLPAVKEIYPDGMVLKAKFDLGFLETILDGKFRPGHFQGVCQVVQRLLEIVEPAQLYLGQKDFQQCMVIKRLIALMHKEDIMIHICETLREKDGLAMSSRNQRLTQEERVSAATIYKTLTIIKNTIHAGNIDKMKEEAMYLLARKGFKPDYVEIANAQTLEPVTAWNGTDKLVALVAAFLGKVRLIDNMLLN